MSRTPEQIERILKFVCGFCGAKRGEPCVSCSRNPYYTGFHADRCLKAFPPFYAQRRPPMTADRTPQTERMADEAPEVTGTPETDAVDDRCADMLIPLIRGCSDAPPKASECLRVHADTHWLMAEHARTLERRCATLTAELAAARQERDEAVARRLTDLKLAYDATDKEIAETQFWQERAEKAEFTLMQCDHENQQAIMEQERHGRLVAEERVRELERTAEQARATAMEEAAKICDEQACRHDLTGDYRYGAGICAMQIRKVADAN